MDKIIEGIRRFQDEVFPRERDLFERLAQGQNPETLIVTCSDSRVSLELMTQAPPGELFVCRNAGNIVPSYECTDAVSASIEYALSVLPIRDLIVCGHSDCGAMKGLLNPRALVDMPHVRIWLAHSQQALRELEWDNDGLHSHEVLNHLAKRNVQLQLEHLQTYPKVLARVQSGSLRLHGWFYQIDAGEIQHLASGGSEWVALHDKAPATPMKRRAAGSQEVHHA